MDSQVLAEYTFPKDEFAKSLFPFTMESTSRLFCLTESNKLMEFTLQNAHLNLQKTLQYESVLYDVQVLKEAFITSCKDMPVRIRCLTTGQCLGSINDRKQNSEKYLAPLSMKVTEGSIGYGVGKKFMSEYDIQHCCRTTRFKQFDKKFLSSISLQNYHTANYNNLAIVGDFLGELSIVDINSRETVHSTKVHLDGITDIQFHPQDNNFFVSSARCDNFKYLWDVRMLNTFVRFYEVKNSTNQRINFQLKGSSLYCGDQIGNLSIFDIQTGYKQSQYRMFAKSLNWLAFHQKYLIMGSGQRNFDQIQAVSPSGKLRIYNQV